MFKSLILAALILIVPLFAQSKGKETVVNITLESSAFKEGELIPSKFTCDGANISPELNWSGIPADTKSIALICDDPDAPVGDWVHWVVYNIPTAIKELKENVPPGKKFADGMTHGLNDFKQYGYGGPCPPSGVHRYYFKIYALDTILKLEPGATKKDLLKNMEKHILAEGRLMGKYKRK